MSVSEQIAYSWVKAFNGRDLDSLLNLYAGDARHYSPKLKVSKPETKGYIQGHEAMRKWWADAFSRLPRLHYNLKTVTPCDDRVFIEYIRQLPDEPDMLVAEVFEIQSGKIIESRVYHG